MPKPLTVAAPDLHTSHMTEPYNMCDMITMHFHRQKFHISPTGRLTERSDIRRVANTDMPTETTAIAKRGHDDDHTIRSDLVFRMDQMCDLEAIATTATDTFDQFWPNRLVRHLLKGQLGHSPRLTP